MRTLMFIGFLVIFFAGINALRFLGRAVLNLLPSQEEGMPDHSYKPRAAAVAAATVAAVTAAPAALANASPEPIEPTTKASPTPASPHVFQIADSTHLVVFDEGWSVTLRVYQDSMRATRHLRCTDRKLAPRIRQAHGTCVFEMSEVSLLGSTIEGAMRDAEKAGVEKLMDVIGAIQPHVAAIKGKDAGLDVAVAAESAFAPVPLLAHDVDETGVAETDLAIDDLAASTSVVTGGGEHVFVGSVVSAGLVPAAVGNGQVFQVELKRSNSDKIECFRGVDLATQCNKLGIKPGERIELRTRSNPAAATERFAPRNLFIIDRV